MAKILVVDDNEDVLALLKDYLQELKGHTLYTARNAEEAIQQYEAHRPSIVLLDILLPGVNGIEILGKIKRLDPKAHVIMISGVDNEDVAKSAMQKGAADFITKPLDLEYLETQITFEGMRDRSSFRRGEGEEEV